ncbi:flagellar hook-associated protein FlgK [Oceanobacillus manasiensis]|uniref:flagellar hook-associated protein FlgK n=1 Tax=Oceanobacillus manasiensis TaxID=586413 RepID=UPI000A01D65C|nr:flagellar hook-associated protein FlgK [Oceanobacillus manasiensis]
MSTFHGLEMAKQALFTQQSALYTTGHNISNANTEGYSRQRVNFETMNPFPAGSRNRPEIPGQLGTGVQAGSVERVRDSFLDYQYRSENSKTGYWESLSSSYVRMEGIMNEPSDSGLSKTMDSFWQSLQDLATTPENSGARSVVVERGRAVAETFNYLSESLSSIRTDLKTQIGVSVSDANSLLRQIDGVNAQIGALEPHGYLPNDLYDERDRLVDKLSGMMNIKVSYDKSSESSPDIAAGLASIEVVDNKGKALNPPVKLVDGTNAGNPGAVNEISVAYADDNTAAVTGLTAGGNSIMSSNGSIKGLIDAYGYEAEDGVSGTYTDMLTDLDKMAKTFADAFNKVHRSGKDLDGKAGVDFFEFKDGLVGTAEGLKVNQDVLDEPDLIAAAPGDETGNTGNGGNASKLAEVFNDTSLADDPLGENTSVNTFYQSLIGEMGVKAQEASRMTNNANVLRSQVENQRMSVSSVSLDEEMSNMIKFQHAYSAAARSMTTIDEMIDRVINNMGLVGR